MSAGRTKAKYQVALQESEEGFSVWVPGLPGCVSSHHAASRRTSAPSQGDTEEEALANIAEAVREYLDVAAENAAGMVIREIEVAV